MLGVRISQKSFAKKRVSGYPRPLELQLPHHLALFSWARAQPIVQRETVPPSSRTSR